MKETTATRRSSTSGRPGLLAVALDDVQHAGRQARLGGEPREDERGLGRVLRCLQHRCVPAEKRREDLPRDVCDRRVRSDDQAGDPERLANRHRLPVRRRARHRLAVEAPPFTGDEVAELDRAARLAERVLRALARLGGDNGGDLVPVALEQLCDPAEDPAALLDGAVGPRRLRVDGGRDRGVGVARVRARDEADHLAGRRRELLEGRSARRGTLLPADHVAHRLHVHRNRHSFNGASSRRRPTRWRTSPGTTGTGPWSGSGFRPPASIQTWRSQK